MKTLALISAALLLGYATPVIQVRDVAKTPNVIIVAWDPGMSSEYGLRTRLRRDGSHQGDGRAGEHRLFLNSTFVTNEGGFAHAVAHDGKLLRNSGSATDNDACLFGDPCSPKTTVGLGLADDYLRANKDSLVVTMRPRGGRNWTIRLDKGLIEAYLRTVDSASAAMKKPAE